MFNVAQGFKDIANKLISGLPIKNGGTGYTNNYYGWFNISNGANQSYCVITGNQTDSYLEHSGSTYFMPLASSAASMSSKVDTDEGHIMPVYGTVENVTWNNISNPTIGIGVDTAEKSAGYYIISGNIRYLKEDTTKNYVQTAIVRKRGDSYTNITWITGNYANERISHSFCQIVYLEPGDFVFLGSAKAANSIKVSLENSTKFSAIKLV